MKVGDLVRHVKDGDLGILLGYRYGYYRVFFGMMAEVFEVLSDEIEVISEVD